MRLMLICEKCPSKRTLLALFKDMLDAEVEMQLKPLEVVALFHPARFANSVYIMQLQDPRCPCGIQMLACLEDEGGGGPAALLHALMVMNSW